MVAHARDRMNPGGSGRLGVGPRPPALGKGGVPSRAPTDRAHPAPHNTMNAAGISSTRRVSSDNFQKRRIPPGFRRHRARVLNPAGSPPVGSSPLRAARRTVRGGPLQQAMDRQVVLLTWAREAQKREKNLIAAVHRSCQRSAAGGELAAPADGALASGLSSPAELRALLVDWSKANLERSQQLSTWATQNYQMLQGEMLSEQRRAVSPPQTLLGGPAPAQAGPIGPIGPRYHNIQPAAQSTPMSPVRELPESPQPQLSFKQRLLQLEIAVQHEAAAAATDAHAAAAGRRSPLSSPPASPAMGMEAEHAHGRAPVSPSPAGSECHSEDYLSSADEAAAMEGLLALRQQQQQQGQGMEVEVEGGENGRWQQASTATSTPWMTRPRQAASAFIVNDGHPVSGGEDTATSTTVTTPATGLVFPGPAVIAAGAISAGDAAAHAGNDELELERRLSRVFPDDVLKLGRAEFAAWKAAKQIGPLAPADTKALAKLRRKVLSRVYANRARARRANEREMLHVENERLRSLQSQVEVDAA